MPAIQVPLAKTQSYRLITVAVSIEECKPWFHDLRGETRGRLGRSLWLISLNAKKGINATNMVAPRDNIRCTLLPPMSGKL